MSVLTMPPREFGPHKALSEALRELCRLLSSLSPLRISEDECAELALAALDGEPEAEFTVGSVFDAAGLAEGAAEWYHRAADRGYLPAMLQLVAML
jgi:TPR repeat protein